MKKLIFLLAFVTSVGILMSFTRNAKKTSFEHTRVSDYCEGWEDGYCEGWKDVKGQFTVCPVAPVCPVSEVGTDSYRGGYNRGFKAGMSAARNN